MTTFLQSLEWGNFQEKLGFPVIRLGVFKNQALKAIAQVIKIKAKRGNFLFVPHGPIIKDNDKNQIKLLIKKLTEYLINIAKAENFDFLRIAPILENTLAYKKIFQDLGYKTAPIYLHAETTWVLSLDKTEEEILSQMRKTTRYLIRKAQKQGIVIEKRIDKKAIKDFYDLYLETAKREKFTPFSYDYIQKEFEAFQKTGSCLFFFAKVDLQYLASSLIIFNKNCAFYHQGASIHTKFPSSYLLQWEAIKEAKKRGCQYYNFWGIYDEVSKRTPKSWQGLTLFKTGFGGQTIRYLPTQDFIISPKYYFTYLWERFLWWKRG